MDADARGSWGPVILTNLPVPGAPRGDPAWAEDGEVSLFDAAMRATATPTFLPVHQVGVKRECVP